MPKSSNVPRLNACAISRAKATTSKKVLIRYLRQTLRCKKSILRKLSFPKKRHVKPTDVPLFFGDMPGDETICIETDPKKAGCGESNPEAQGVMLQDGMCVEVTGRAFPSLICRSLNQWVKSYKGDSPWRKVFYKGQPFETYRQILIQERPDQFRPRFHEKNREAKGHKSYLKDHIRDLGIAVSTDMKTLSSQDGKQKREESVDSTKVEVVATNTPPTDENTFDDELLMRRTDFEGSEDLNIIEDIEDDWTMHE